MFTRLKNTYFYYDVSKYENILEDPHSKAGNIINNIIHTLVLLFIIVFALETTGSYSEIYKTELFIFDAFISSIFAGEYFYRFSKAIQKTRFFFSTLRIIDLLSFLPFFLGLVAVGDFLKIFRLLRVLRVLKLVKKIPLTAGFVKSLKDYLDEYKAVFILFLVVLFIGSSFVYFFEKDVLNTSFTSIPVTLWWGLVTMTAVGYGDMVPLTTEGKVFGSFLVFLGPLVLALVSAVTIMVFMETSRNHELQHKHVRGRHCHKCKTKNPREANYCMKCGEDLLVK